MIFHITLFLSEMQTNHSKNAPEPEPGTLPSMIPSSWLDAPGLKQLVSIADGIVAQLISPKNALD